VESHGESLGLQCWFLHISTNTCCNGKLIGSDGEDGDGEDEDGEDGDGEDGDGDDAYP
jgi:hypothetical protein